MRTVAHQEGMGGGPTRLSGVDIIAAFRWWNRMTSGQDKSAAPSHERTGGARRWRRRGAAAVLACAIAAGGAALVLNIWTWPLARAFVTAPNTGKTVDPTQDPPLGSLRGVHRQFRVEGEGVSLAVWVIEPGGGAEGRLPRGTVLLIHGINASKQSMLALGGRLAAAGYRVVLPDLRGHGRSSGAWCTFGRHESRDMVRVADELEHRGLLAGPLMELGQSLGGAVAIQHAAIDARVRCVVSLSTFESYRSVVPLYVRRALPWVWWTILPGTIDRAIDHAGAIADFNPDDASPAHAIAAMKTPVLLLHGTADRNIPPSHAHAIHAAAPDHCELTLIPAAGHNLPHDPAHLDEVARRSLDWLEDHSTMP